MSTAIAHADTSRSIQHLTEPQIIVKEGKRYTIALYPYEKVAKTPNEMLYIIAATLNMDPESFSIKGRSREVVELRFLGALLLRRYFPDIRLRQIAELFGGQDHTSVINAVTRANELLYTHDLAFTTKYNNTIKIVNQWIKEQ